MLISREDGAVLSGTYQGESSVPRRPTSFEPGPDDDEADEHDDNEDEEIERIREGRTSDSTQLIIGIGSGAARDRKYPITWATSEGNATKGK